MSILDTIQTFLSGIWFPSWDVYTDLALILKLLTATECVPYSFDSYVAKYPYYNYPQLYNKQEQPSESKVLGPIYLQNTLLKPRFKNSLSI